MIDTSYVVTKEPEIDGVHFLHTTECQVLPDQELIELGVFDSCEEAMKAAREALGDVPLNACALCCPACYIKSDDDEEVESARAA